jgi:rhodanese-related sulfurtransferase
MAPISASELQTRLATDRPPIVIDVRRTPAYLGATSTLSGALRRDPAQLEKWLKSLPSADEVVVYCVRGHEVSQDAARALGEHGISARYLEGGMAAWIEAEGNVDAKPANAPTRWVTRERPKIDRIACPWLVARFVDPDAEFLYVPTARVLEAADVNDAIPYDIPNVHFSHVGDHCSFDAFIRHYRLRDPALQQLALIVRGADTARLDLAQQAHGLAAISLGLSRNFTDDHEMLRHGMVMYDALYTWCKEGKEEIHTWNPQAYGTTAAAEAA